MDSSLNNVPLVSISVPHKARDNWFLSFLNNGKVSKSDNMLQPSLFPTEILILPFLTLGPSFRSSTKTPLPILKQFPPKRPRNHLSFVGRLTDKGLERRWKCTSLNPTAWVQYMDYQKGIQLHTSTNLTLNFPLSLINEAVKDLFSINKIIIIIKCTSLN